MNTPDDPAEALRRAALSMAIEYHENTARHPTSKGPARPSVVTATAEEFYEWLREVGRRSGVTDDNNLNS